MKPPPDPHSARGTLFEDLNGASERVATVSISSLYMTVEIRGKMTKLLVG
jgi:hypothetical protein